MPIVVLLHTMPSAMMIKNIKNHFMALQPLILIIFFGIWILCGLYCGCAQLNKVERDFQFLKEKK